MDSFGVFGLMVLCLVIFIFWTAFIVPITISFKPKIMHFFMIWLGVPGLALGMLILTGYAFAVYQSSPSVVYRDIVGSDPSPDVTFVNALRHTPTDWDDSYLVFTANEQTIKRILQKGFIPIKYSEIHQYGCEPEWWQPPEGTNVCVFSTTRPDPKWGFFDSCKMLIYDPGDGSSEKRMVYMRYRH